MCAPYTSKVLHFKFDRAHIFEHLPEGYDTTRRQAKHIDGQGDQLGNWPHIAQIGNGRAAALGDERDESTS
jgi:hypothetical protein